MLDPAVALPEVGAADDAQAQRRARLREMEPQEAEPAVDAASASEAVAAAVALRRANAEGAARATASVSAALPAADLRVSEHCKHNISLGKALVRLPLEELRLGTEALLRWERPVLACGCLGTLQCLALSERLRYLPALAMLCAAAHSRLRQARRPPPHRIEYWFRDVNLKQKWTNLNSNIARVDRIAEAAVIALLKLHTAYVTDQCAPARSLFC